MSGCSLPLRGQNGAEGQARDLLWVINIVSASFKVDNAGLLLSMLTQLNEAQLDQKMPGFHILISGISPPLLFLPHQHLKALRNLYY